MPIHPTPPNILVIFTDQQQAHAMSCAGNPDLHTPNIDRLARTGVRYTRAYSTFPLCGPCRSSWITGRYPHQLRTMSNGSALQDDDRLKSVGFRLRSAGYTPAYGGKWHVPTMDLANGVAEQFGFEYVCGFNDDRLADLTSRYLAKAHPQPFCLFASFDNPHNICEHSRDQILPWGTPPIGDPSEHPNLPGNFAPTGFESAVMTAHREGVQTTYSQDRWREYRHVYYRLCEKVDRQIGVILDALDSSNHRQDTVVLLMSDHGDMAGSHGLIQKSVLYDESARVPCIISDPRHPQQHGSTHAALINTGIDLLPTLLHLAGVCSDPGLPGCSMITPAQRSHIVCESLFDRKPFASRMVRSDRYKYIVHDRYRHPEMLFDMDNDPGEMLNLAVEKRYAPVVAQHRAWLYQWCQETLDTFGSHHTHVPAAVLPGYGFENIPARLCTVPDEDEISN